MGEAMIITLILVVLTAGLVLYARRRQARNRRQVASHTDESQAATREPAEGGICLFDRNDPLNGTRIRVGRRPK